MKSHLSSGIILLLSSFVFVFLSYFVDRVEYKYFVDSSELIYLLLGALFLFYASYLLAKKSFTFYQLLGVGIFIRCLALFALPNLSDDYFRYLWDGHLFLNGVNPFDFLPSEIIGTSLMPDEGINHELYNGFNSQNYYSVYPPFVQFIFSASVWLGGSSLYAQIVWLRVFTLFAEFGSLYFLLKLLDFNKMRLETSWFYILNPLILMEFTVNLHTEVFMIFFMLAGIYFVVRQSVVKGGVFWAMAISAKLLPLMFLPLFYKQLKLKGSIIFYTTSLVIAGLTFIPFVNETFLPHIKSSIDLYFGTFQFNGSVVYFLNYLGKYTEGYDITYLIMPLISKLFFVGICIYGLRVVYKSNFEFVKAIFITYLLYLLFAAIVHPWYITLFVPLSIILNKRWGVAWSFLALLTYAAYYTAQYTEYTFILWIEYIGLFLFILWDFISPLKKLES